VKCGTKRFINEAKSVGLERSEVMIRTRLSVANIVLAVMFALIPFAGVVSAQGGGTTVAGGFNGPQGVLVAPDGSVWVIDSGVGGDTEIPFFDPETGEETTATIGETARVVQIAPDGTQTVAASLPSVLVGMEASGGARLALLNGTLYATSGAWIDTAGDAPATPTMSAVVKIEGGEAIPVVDTWALENARNPDGFVKESHPYGLAAGPDGNLWVADAGANTLIRIIPDSDGLDLVAVFDGLPSPLPNPNRGGAMESDPVPTGVAFDGDGNIYVSFLPGFPFLPGSAKVVKVTLDGQVSDYATGLTMITDLRTGPDGELYAVQLGQFTEEGPVPNSGAIIHVKEGAASESIVDSLSFPTSIDFGPDGDAYVTINGVGAPGSGEVVMFANLATQAEATPPPEALPITGGERATGVWQILGSIALGLTLVAFGLLLKRGRPWARERH
jgi:sugar lactone lactonase YvrE